MTWYVWTGLGTLRPAVVVSVAVVALAAWRAAMRLGAPWIPLASQYLALAGATLLLASQAVLAVRRFRRPFPASRGVELGLYAAAQFLIALSVRS